MSKEIYYYKGNPYTILSETKIKVGDMWKDCIVYKCEYENPDGSIWVRQRQEFFELFKPKAKRPTMSLEAYSSKAMEFTTMTGLTLINYSKLGMLEEIGELAGKIAKNIRGDYAIIADDRHIDSTKEASGKYIRVKDLMLEVGDIIWMLNAYLYDNKGIENLYVVDTVPKRPTTQIRLCESIVNLNKYWINGDIIRAFTMIIHIIEYFGYTLEEVLYLNIEKLEQRRINNTIQGNGDNR